LDGPYDKKFLMQYQSDNPNTWTREQLISGVRYYRAKVKRMRDEYEIIIEEYEKLLGGI